MSYTVPNHYLAKSMEQDYRSKVFYDEWRIHSKEVYSSGERQILKYRNDCISPGQFVLHCNLNTGDRALLPCTMQHAVQTWLKCALSTEYYLQLGYAPLHTRIRTLLTSFSTGGSFMPEKEPNFVSLDSIALQKIQHVLIISYGAF